MSIEVPMLTKKYRRHLIRQIKQQKTSAFEYGEKSDFFSEVMGAFEPSAVTLMFEEIIMDDIKAVIDEDSRMEFKQADLFGYAEKTIKLPNQSAVQVKYATLDHMETQRQLIIENHLKQIRAFVVHHDHIVVPIIDAMKQNGFQTAGDAIQFLAQPA